MRICHGALLVVLIAGCSSGVESGLSPDQAKTSLLAKTESEYEKLRSKVDSGTVPDDIRRLPREVSAMAGLLTGDAAPLGDKLKQQVTDFEALISNKKKVTVEEAKKALDEIGATISEIKEKL